MWAIAQGFSSGEHVAKHYPNLHLIGQFDHLMASVFPDGVKQAKRISTVYCG